MAHVITNNHHNNHDYDDDNNQQTATTKTALTKANISINNSVNNANDFVLDNDNNRLYRQSSSDDLSYEKHYNEETFIEFDDNEESGSDHSSPTSTPSILDLNKLTTSYHIRQADDALGRLKTVAEPLGWKKLLTHKSGVVVYGKPGVTKDDKIPVFMGEHIIKGFAPQSIFAVIGTRKLWDDWYEEGSLVENLNETTSLTYMVIQALAGSKARDLSLVEKIECTLEGKIYFVSTSVYTPKVPHISNRIRAHIHLNGWILEPLSYNPPVTKVNYVLQTSVKGWIPPLVAKKYLSRRPLVIHTIEAYLQKNGPPTMFIKTSDDYSPTTSQISSYAASTLSFTKNNNNNNNNTNLSFTRYDDSEKSEQSIDQHNSTDSFSNLTNIINNITIDNNSSNNGNNNHNDDDDTDVKGYDGNTSATDSPSPVPIVNGINRNGTRKIKFFDESGLRSKSLSSETTPGTVFTHNYRSVIDTFKSLPSLPPNPTESPSSPSSSSPPITEKSITNVKNIITTTPTTNVNSNAIVTPTTIPTTSTPTTPQTPITTSLEKINIKIPEKNKTTHRHSESLNVAIDNFETEAMSFDGWSFHSDSKGVKIYTKDVEGKSTPIMRGETRISGGFTVEDVLSIISSIEMRKIWDERFEDGIMLEKLNHSDILAKSMLKGSFPVSGRDLSVVSTTKYDLDTGIVGFITTSVIDPLIPETRKHVRARLSFAGFKLIPEFDDNGFTKHVDVKYIVDIDIKLDTIPSSILKQISIQTPMTLIKIDELLQKSGFPPYIRESTSQTSMKSRTINTKTFECDIEVTNVFLGAVTELKVSRKMYPGGYELTTQPENVKVELLPNKVEVVRIVTLSGVNVDDNTSVMKIKIKRNTSKGVKVTYNGGKAIPLASLSPSSENTTEVPTSPKPGSNDQNRRPVTTPEYINQNDTSNSIKKTLPIIEPSRSILSPSIPLPPKFVSQIPVINSNGDDDDNNTNVITANHHQETSASTLVEPLVEKNNDNDENKEKSITEEQIFKHLTKTTTTVDGEGEDSQTVSINNLNNHFASFTDSFRFNTQQVGLMFASMLLAYYAGKLSG